MGMKQTLDVINRMEADGIIGRYAIAGAVAAFNYIEPALTEDLDLLVSFNRSADHVQPGLIVLSPVFAYLRDKGYSEHRNAGIVIEGWPVQFLPAANALDDEALAQAQEIAVAMPGENAAVTTRVLRPEHLVATALRVGRPKDLIRISQFLDSQAVDLKSLAEVIDRHQLGDAWRQFCRRTGLVDPLPLQSRS
jgi:hypothetical protein